VNIFRRMLSRGNVRPAPPVDWPTYDDKRLDRTSLRPGPPASERDLPRAAIVILNFNGRHHLDGCFESLRGLDYPEDRLEVVLVDNGSNDGSVEHVKAAHGWVHLVENERNAGFSAGCNQGAHAASRPEVLVFLNNDMRVEPSWLRELVGPLVRSECQATTAKMYSWDGRKMNSAGGGMNFHGIGIQRGYLEDPGPEHDEPQRSLFACGGAMAIDAAVYHDVGGFDEEFFAYYEDVDLGWRMWVLGHEVHYTPSAVCFHHHSSTSRTFPMETIRLLQARNPFLSCFKNYDDDNLRTILPAQLALALRRSFLVAGVEDDAPFRIEEVGPRQSGVVGRLWEKARHHTAERFELRREAVADFIGINDLLGNWDHWMERRAEVQRRRQRSDEEIFKLFVRPMWCIEDETSYRELHLGVTRFFGIDRLFEGLTAKGKDPHK
jgi:GT2 family glycosyltransferase